jgi:tellurite resistance protein TerC
MRQALRLSRKIGVAAAGGGVLVLGVALIVLPGPAIIVIPLGLALLATEFPWAARLLLYLKERSARVVGRLRRAVPARSPT